MKVDKLHSSVIPNIMPNELSLRDIHCYQVEVATKSLKLSDLLTVKTPWLMGDQILVLVLTFSVIEGASYINIRIYLELDRSKQGHGLVYWRYSIH